jgi:hypothetical protein
MDGGEIGTNPHEAQDARYMWATRGICEMDGGEIGTNPHEAQNARYMLATRG